MRLFAAMLAALTLVAGCGAAEDAARVAGPAAAPEPGLPAPDSRLPRDPEALAERLTQSTRALDDAIAAWLATRPGRRARPPEAVTLLALDQQRIYRLMRRRPRTGRAVIAAMPARLQSSARDNYAAGRSLLRLAPKEPPRHAPKVRTGRPEAPRRLVGWYRSAQRRFGVAWNVLAAVNLIESGFGRMRNASYAGAQGPMQFIPSTWEAYGLGGDVHDPRDAIMGAANYLHASGAPASYRRALYAYNPSSLYVDAVLRYARQIRRNPRRLYAYWSWQVWVRTPDGDRRLTGPGLPG